MLHFGPQLAAWRLARNLTQAQLAQKAHVSRPNLSAIEQGKRDITLGTLDALARALGVTPGKLLDEQPPLPFRLDDRHLIDAVARAVVSGKRPFEAALNLYADDMAALITRKLGAARAPGLSRVSHLKWINGQRPQVLRRRYGASLVKRLLDRVEKHLPYAG